MANSLLTIDMITNEALRILHQKSNFIRNINRQYDDSFAREGAKIGSSLRIRLPNQYTVASGATLSSQDTTESQVTLNVTSQKHVGLKFTANELTLSLDDFSERILQPAISVLAANIEADALTMANDVYQAVDNRGAACSYRKVLEGRKLLVDSLSPTNGLKAVLNTQDNVDMVDTLKGLMNPVKNISSMYADGLLGEAGGFQFYENTLIANSTTGTATLSDFLVNGSQQSGATLTVDTGSGSWAKGDIFTIANVFKVHPESKTSTGILQQFVVTTLAAAAATSLSISPAITLTGASQNVNALPADNAALTKIGTTSTVYKPSLLFHPDAFTFATADLIMPDGVDMKARKVFDGISMRIVRQYDINYDNMPCRVDVLYGYKTIRPQLAARILSN